MNSNLTAKHNQATHDESRGPILPLPKNPVLAQPSSAIVKPRSPHRALLFASTEEAVVYLELMGFTVEGKQISYDRWAIATHRTLFAIDRLCSHGFTCAPVQSAS